MKTPSVRLCLAMTLLLWSATVVRADVTLPAIIGDHMVLQREAPLPIWGWAAPGEEVTVALGDNKATTKADAKGNWQVKLAPMKSGGGPLEMTISGKNSIKLTDILIGEVWMGSGQSSMQWSVAQSTKGADEIAAANHPKIRLFYVLGSVGDPVKTVNASWVVCSPATVPNFSAVCYFFGRELHKDLDVPVGMIATSWGGTRIEPWIPPVGFASQKELAKDFENLKVEAVNANHQAALNAVRAQFRVWLEAADKAIAAGTEIPNPPAVPNHPYNSSGVATGLYNGMIHPLAPFAIRGALWYQGESNRGQGMQYHILMKALIQGWRTVWNQGDFPFLYVQLAPYRYGNPFTALPEIWEAQTATLAVPNTGMVVTTDIATVNDIHPPNKQDVGKRLALWALAKTYGKTGTVYSGPLFESLTVEGNQAKLKFKFSEGGLIARDGKPLSWFSIAGEDKKFFPATATISGETVVVESPSVAKPVAVRFGWHELAEPNLANKAGLPASPFRTDTWTDATPAAIPGQ